MSEEFLFTIYPLTSIMFLYSKIPINTWKPLNFIFFKTRLMYVPPFLPSFIIGYASIHIVFIYVTTFGNESEHNSHITILVFHTTSEEAERIYTGPPFMFPNKHSNMQSRERERKNQQASCQSIAWVLRDLHFISGVKVSAFFSIDCFNI